MKYNTINLDSDDEPPQFINTTSKEPQRVSETIEILSDNTTDLSDVDDEVFNVQIPNKTTNPVLNNDTNTNQIKLDNTIDEPELTPQQLMRKKLAEAAERRLKPTSNDHQPTHEVNDEPIKQEKRKEYNELEDRDEDDMVLLNDTMPNIKRVQTKPIKRVESFTIDDDDDEDDINWVDDPIIQPPPNKNTYMPNKSTQTTQTHNKNNLLNTSKADNTSRIRMIANPTYCKEFKVNGDVDAVSLNDLVGSKGLIKTYQFNMLIDFDYLASFVNNKSCEYVLICKNDRDHLHIQPSSYNNYNVKVVDVTENLPKFGTHHTKMMVNFYDDKTCQIVVHTMNMTQADHLIQTQMCWVSPVLKMHTDRKKYLDFNTSNISIKKDTGTVFKRDFIAYLLTYKKEGVNDLINQIGKYDFTPIDVVFVASSPGNYHYENWETLTRVNAKPMFGYGRLWQVIHTLGLQCLHGKFIGQASTIAGPCDSWKRNLFVYLLTSCVEKGFPLIKKADYSFEPYMRTMNKVEPILIWPTIDEVLKSRSSMYSGIALHLKTVDKWEAYERQYLDIRKYLHKWTTNSDTPYKSKAGRSNLSSHTKTYTVTEDNFKTLKWFLLTSANISHQAWGKFKKYNLIDYDISSFEAGIFVAPELLNVPSNVNNHRQILVPTYGKDDANDVNFLSNDNKFKIGLRLPYDTPLVKYSANENPWAQPETSKYIQ